VGECGVGRESGAKETPSEALLSDGLVEGTEALAVSVALAEEVAVMEGIEGRDGVESDAVYCALMD